MVLLDEQCETRQEYTMMMDWVDQVADDIFSDAINSQELLVCDGAGDLWETISAGSVEDLDFDDAIDISDYLVSDEAMEVTQVPREEAVQVQCSPSRSSTPSRSVRNRRRIIGAVRPMTPMTQAHLEPVQISPTMKRQASAPAISLDIGNELIPPSLGCGGRQTPVSKSSMSALALDLGADAVATPTIPRSGRQTPLSSLSRSIGMSKSMSALHATSSFNDLGLSWSTSLKPGGKGVLPMLSDSEKNRKNEMIAWSVNMAKTKRGGLRSVF